MPKTLLTFDKKEVTRILEEIGGDGHAIYDKNELATALDIEPSRLDAFAKEHVSKRGDFKQTIFTSNGIASEMTGVYGLEMLKQLYREAELDMTDLPMGRGFTARLLTERLRKFVAESME